MSSAKDIAGLQRVAQLMLDHQLTHLQTIARRRAETEAALARLDQLPTSDELLLGASPELVALNYQRWCEARRVTLVQALAAQTEEWQAARHAAQQAWGKCQALQGIVNAARPRGK